MEKYIIVFEILSISSRKKSCSNIKNNKRIYIAKCKCIKCGNISEKEFYRLKREEYKLCENCQKDEIKNQKKIRSLLCTESSNSQVTKGVFFDKYKNKWCARISNSIAPGVTRHKFLGEYDTYEEAVSARLAAVEEKIILLGGDISTIDTVFKNSPNVDTITPYKALLGKKFGINTVTEILSNGIKIKCDCCERERIVRYRDLIDGNCNSCKCKINHNGNYEIGKVIKGWKIIQIYDQNNKICECTKCGNQRIFSNTSLKQSKCICRNCDMNK